jgi:hypothetical protein
MINVRDTDIRKQPDNLFPSTVLGLDIDCSIAVCWRLMGASYLLVALLRGCGVVSKQADDSISSTWSGPTIGLGQCRTAMTEQMESHRHLHTLL